jgi:hypothetical protein
MWATTMTCRCLSRGAVAARNWAGPNGNKLLKDMRHDDDAPAAKRAKTAAVVRDVLARAPAKAMLSSVEAVVQVT